MPFRRTALALLAACLLPFATVALAAPATADPDPAAGPPTPSADYYNADWGNTCVRLELGVNDRLGDRPPT